MDKNGEKMLNHVQEYINTVNLDEIPWHRLSTVYKRATDFPEYFDILWQMENMEDIKNVLKEISMDIEHQSTLMHATAFELIFLLRIFQRSLEKRREYNIAEYIYGELLEVFTVIAEAIHEGIEIKQSEYLPQFSDMLKEEYLWSEEYDEEEDEMRYEENELWPNILFYSFYHYSYQVLILCKVSLQAYKEGKQKVLYDYLDLNI